MFFLYRKGVNALKGGVKNLPKVSLSSGQSDGQTPSSFNALPASMNMDESELLGDAKYRNYVTAVEKALKAFEYSSEWADLISALGKLNKVNETSRCVAVCVF